MTYYNWEEIVRHKSIGELKKLLKDDLLGKDAAKCAIIELVNRYNTEHSLDNQTIDNINVRIDLLLKEGVLEDKEYIFLKSVLDHTPPSQTNESREKIGKQFREVKVGSYFLGILQIVGGMLGIYALTTLLQFTQFSIKDVVVIVLGFCMVLLSVVAGIFLITERKRIIWSQIHQLLQLVHIKTSVFTFSYSSGAAIFSGIVFVPVYRLVIINPIVLYTKIELYWSYGFQLKESFFFINLLSLIVLLYLSRIKAIMKKVYNTEIYDDKNNNMLDEGILNTDSQAEKE